MQNPKTRIKALRAPDGVLDIPIIGEVQGWFADELIRMLMAYKPSEVRFIMRSPGGLAFEVMDVLDYMNANGIKSYSEIYGECSSAATFLAAHSTPERTAVTKSTRFGIHRASGSIGDDVFVTHANERIIELYTKAFGWSVAKATKLLDANSGTGSVWMGEEIIAEGIASELLDEMKVAARMDRVNDIINTKDMLKVKAKVSRSWENVTAFAANGEVEVEVDPKEVEAAVADSLKTATDELAQAVSDRQAAEASAKEAADKVTALEAQLKEVEEKAAKVEATEATVNEVTAKLADATKNITNLQNALTKALDLPAGAPPVQVNEEGIVSPLKAPGTEPVKPANTTPAPAGAARAAIGEYLQQRRDKR